MKWFAHRGIHDRNGLVENSRKAVESALRSQADGIEVDLRMLGDGDIVLHHDNNLGSRATTNHPYTLVSSLTLEDFRKSYDHEILSLNDLFELNLNSKKIILEMKSHKNNPAFARRLVSGLNECSWETELVLSSLDWNLLFFVERLTNVTVVPVVSDMSPIDRTNMRNKNYNEIHLEKSLCTEDRITLLNDLGYSTVTAWTVNDSSEASSLESRNIQGIMTDNSTLFGN